MAFFHPVPGNPYCWNRVIPGVLTDAMTYDEMIAHAMWKMDKIVDYLIHTVPYLIQVELDANSESCTLTGFLYDNYEKREFNHTFTVGGSPDGKYYVNYRSAGPGVEPISETDDPIFVSQEYMPMNSTTLYSFEISGGKILPDSVEFNDLYTHMHNTDPEAHKELFEAVYAKIDVEIGKVNAALAQETSERKAADTQLQANIDAEKTAREQADTNLQSQITANDTDISGLTTRMGTAESNIAGLNGRMSSAETNITSLQNDLAQETADRVDDVNQLTQQITTETQQRQQQDTQLNNNINSTIERVSAIEGAYVKSVNGISGAPKIVGGANVTVTPSGSNITISATGGGGSAGVSSVNNVTGAVNLVAGSNVTITPSGQNITIAASAGVSDIKVNSGTPLTGSVDFLDGSGINMTASGNTITVNNTGVSSLGVTGGTSITGDVKLFADPTTHITVTPAQNRINFGLSNPMKFQTANALGVNTGTNGFASPVYSFNKVTLSRQEGVDTPITAHFPGECRATVMSVGKGNFADSSGFDAQVNFENGIYDGLYIAVLNVADKTVYAYAAGDEVFRDTSDLSIPFAYIWISTDGAGNIIDWSYELIGAKVPEEPKSTLGTVWYYDPATSQNKTATIFIQRVDNNYIIPPFTFNQAIPTTASSSGVSRFLRFSAPQSKSSDFSVPNAGLITIYEGLETDMGVSTKAAYVLNVSVQQLPGISDRMFELSVYAGSTAKTKNGFSFSGCVITV
jgi:predicted  nucleic acid-binding Zn-ribbon protein